MNTRVKPLNPTKIHVMVYENGATLEDLATEYGMPVEEFCKKSRTVVGVKKFEVVKRMCSRNQKLRKREQERERKKAKQKQLQENPVQEESLEEKKKKLEKSFEHAKNRASMEYETIRQIHAICRVKQSQQEEAEKMFQMAQDQLKQAEKRLKTAMEEYENAKKEKSSHEEKFLMWTRQRKAIQQSLDEFHKNDIYLIAPNYKGITPRVGRFISTQEIPYLNVEIEQGSILMEDSIETTGDLNEKSAIEFAKLVLKYYLGDEADSKITILVNEDIYKQILLLQGIEV